MTLRQLGWTGAAVLFLLGLAGLWTLQGTHSISLTENEVQARIDAKLNKDFAVSGPAGLLIRAVAVQGATLRARRMQKASRDNHRLPRPILRPGPKLPTSS